MQNQENVINENEQTKKCTKCDEIKPLSEFYKCKSNRDGLQFICKYCKSILNKDPKKKEYDKKYSIEYNKDPLNKIKKYEHSKKFQKENPEKQKFYSKKFKDSEKGKQWRVEYRKKEYDEKYGKDLDWTLKLILRNRLKNAIKNEFKSGKTLELLGCSIEEFKIHLEKQFNENMNWDNRGSYWEIDHIKPIALFDLTNPEQQRECFYYTNLQPLEKITNRIKSSKYEQE